MIKLFGVGEEKVTIEVPEKVEEVTVEMLEGLLAGVNVDPSKAIVALVSEVSSISIHASSSESNSIRTYLLLARRSEKMCEDFKVGHYCIVPQHVVERGITINHLSVFNFNDVAKICTSSQIISGPPKNFAIIGFKIVEGYEVMATLAPDYKFVDPFIVNEERD